MTILAFSCFSIPAQADSKLVQEEARKLVQPKWSCDDVVKLNPPTITEDGQGIIFDKTTAYRIVFVLKECVPKWKKQIEKQDIQIDLLVHQVHTATTALAESKLATKDAIELAVFWKDQWKDAADESIWESNEFWLLLGITIGAGSVALATRNY